MIKDAETRRFSLDQSLVRTLLVTLCRLLTGVRSFWHSLPDTEQATIYYAPQQPPRRSGHLGQPAARAAQPGSSGGGCGLLEQNRPAPLSGNADI